MKNISFDNPYWLLLAIPLLLAVIIPYFIAKSKDNRSAGWLASLIIHVVVIISVTLAAAGLIHTTVMTRTKVYIVADVSYSSNRNLDKIDEYIQKISDELPSNSRLGVVCFGNDSVIHVSSGTELKSVKSAVVDDSGTDIAAALDFTSTLFSENELKRIIVITDGFDTTAEGKTAAAVERVVAKDIKIDTIYLDNNLKEGDSEIQISDVSLTSSTYINHETSVGVMLETNVKNDVTVELYVKDSESGEYSAIDRKTVFDADIGINMVSFRLPTDVSGVFDYKVEIAATADTSIHNNAYTFTQTVAGKRNVLLISGNDNDIMTLKTLYADDAEIDFRHITSRTKDVPYTIEALTQYDEIIVSNVDISTIDNIDAFVDSLDVVVSQYGKSLITLGNLYMQNKDEEIYKKFEELLPVSFGNANKDAKLYTIVIDISRSMYYARPMQLIVAKDAATKLVSILDDDDYVSFVTFAGETKIELIPTRLGDCREELYEMIQSVKPSQGTFIGSALEMAFNHMNPLDFEEKQVMLISDGKTYAYEPESAINVAGQMKNSDITLSTVAVLNHSPQVSHTSGCQFLSDLAETGGGNYYELLDESAVAELVFATIGDELTESIVEEETKVNIESYRDDVLEGISDVSDIYGYINTKLKLDANMILSVDYKKNSETTIPVPLYAYRDHGNGKVASFTSDISGKWLNNWANSMKNRFFKNVLTSNTPDERVNYPYEISIEHHGNDSTIEISPSLLNPKAKAEVKITAPSGEVIKRPLTFDLNKYSTVFDTSEVGKYRVEITYTYGNHSFTSDTYFNISYGAEYDSFTAYDVASIYAFMRGAGQVSTNGELNLENDKSEVSTYELSFRLPLLVFAVALFVIDVFIRKFKWRDIKGFFSRKAKKGAKVQ